jgi:hypothetical protein
MGLGLQREDLQRLEIRVQGNEETAEAGDGLRAAEEDLQRLEMGVGQRRRDGRSWGCSDEWHLMK